jgi:LytS/YehU family sensor histidine kinase
MADDLEQYMSLSSVAQNCYLCLHDALLRTRSVLSKNRKTTWPFVIIVAVVFTLFALFSCWVGIQIHAYYIYKAYGLTWFENQLPSIAEISGEGQPFAASV